MNHGMRLLLVTDAVGGVWVYSLELARALQPLGVETVLAVMGPAPSAAQREEARGIKIVETGLTLDWVETSPGALRTAGQKIAGLATRERADIVQTCSAAFLADCDFAQPCVAVQHSCVASWWSAVKGGPLPQEFAWRRDLVEAGLNRADAVVAPSISFAADTARVYDMPVPPSAVHNGRSDRSLAAVPRGDFVLSASRLWDEGKNVATLDKAAAKLRVPFEAAGSRHGPNGACISLDHLRALGHVSSARLNGLLAARPIFASASLYEPFGLSVLEAASAGCALVLSDIPTHRELWSGAAIFVSGRDHDAFASAFDDLLNDPDERQQLGQLARARAQHYSPERMARGMADIYRALVPTARTEMPLELAGAA